MLHIKQEKNKKNKWKQRFYKTLKISNIKSQTDLFTCNKPGSKMIKTSLKKK